MVGERRRHGSAADVTGATGSNGELQRCHRQGDRLTVAIEHPAGEP